MHGFIPQLGQLVLGVLVELGQLALGVLVGLLGFVALSGDLGQLGLGGVQADAEPGVVCGERPDLLAERRDDGVGINFHGH